MHPFVWDYFTKSKNLAVCNQCGKQIRGERPNTTCEKHLKNFHPDSYGELIGKKIKQHFLWEFFNKQRDRANCLQCQIVIKGYAPVKECESHLQEVHPESYEELVMIHHKLMFK